jgi:hypothetical protein
MSAPPTIITHVDTSVCIERSSPTKTEKESDAKRISELAEKANRGVEQTLWSEENNCYLDMGQTHYYNKNRILTEMFLFT